MYETSIIDKTKRTILRAIVKEKRKLGNGSSIYMG